MRLMEAGIAPTMTAMAFATNTLAAMYCVSPHGNNASDGLGSEPTQALRTIQTAVEKLQPGDTLLIHGGTYRETVTFPHSGTAEKPIRVKPYKNENVVVSGWEGRPVCTVQIRSETEMAKETVVIFRQYSFKTGQKIRIEGGQRAGDWEVRSVGERKVTLRCPVSGRQFQWDRFCYFIEEMAGIEWPEKG